MNAIQGISLKSRLLATLLLFQASDVSTRDGRAKERDRRILITAATSVGAKGASVAASIVLVPLILNYLGAERYGLWMTISSFVPLMGFTDLGVGFGLLNAVSEAHGKNDDYLAQEYVSSGLFMLAALAIALGLLFALVSGYVRWQAIFNVRSPLAALEAGPAVRIFIVCFLLNIVLGTAQKVQWGYQEGFMNSVWDIIGSVFMLVGAWIAVASKAGLPWVVLTLAGAQTLAGGFQCAALFGIRRPWLIPKWRHVSWAAVGKIMRLGFFFFIIQAEVSLAYASDNIITAQVLGPEAVAQYSVAFRLFTIPSVILSMILMPLWPAYGEANARGDLPWIRSALWRSLKLTLLVAGICSGFLTIFGERIIVVWAGPNVRPSFGLVIGLAVWCVLGSLGNTLAMFLNGLGILGFQMSCGILVAIAAIVGKVVLAGVFGTAGIVWGTILGYACFIGVPYLFYVPRLLARMHNQHPS